MNVGKHVWMMDNVFFLDDSEKSILSINRETVRQGKDSEVKHVADVSSIAPEHVNILIAAPMLYQQLTYQYHVLDSILAALEVVPHSESLSRCLTNAQNSILLTQRAALEGINKVADEIESQRYPGWLT